MFKKMKFWFAYQILRAVYFLDASFFGKSLSCVADTQRKVLFRILRDNAGTEIGKMYGFSSVSDVNVFATQIPISTYQDYSHYVERIALGEKNVLTRDSTLVLEPSSGSSGPSKYIPYNRSLRKEYRKALAPWIYDLITYYPRVLKGPAYWSITPAAHDTKFTEGGIPIGFKNDSEYFGKLARCWIKKIFAVPEEVSGLKDVATFRYVTLLFLLQNRDLRFISIWNPSFLPLLLEPLWEWKEMLLQDIESGTISPTMRIDSDLKIRLTRQLSPDPGRARELNEIFNEHPLLRGSRKGAAHLYKRIWPDLSLISCWTDGNAALNLSELKSCFPEVEIQPKGLIATEAVVSFPLFGQKAGVLAVNSHFFEFIELSETDQKNQEPAKTKLAHEVELGKQYLVIVTTGGGLYRYNMQDCVEVVGFVRQCPVITFIGKSDMTMDLCGEKLNEHFVSLALKKIFLKHKINPDFFMVAPCQDKAHKYHYGLFLRLGEYATTRTNVLLEMAIDLEVELRSNFHYNYCRNLGQLQPARIFLISSECQAAARYLQRRNQEGQRLGSIKPAVIDKGMNWQEVFCGAFVSERSSLIESNN